MTFPNAFEGVKKVFIAEILALIASGCMVLGAIIAAASAMAGSLSGAAGGGFFVIASFVLSLLSLIFNLIGLSKASQDEAAFKTAFYCAIVNLIATFVIRIIGIAVPGNAINYVSTIISTALSIAIIRYVVKGITSLAEKLGRNDIIDYGGKIAILLYIVYGVSILLNLLSWIFSGSLSMAATIGVFSILSGIAGIVGYILYLVYLSRAKNMLETA